MKYFFEYFFKYERLNIINNKKMEKKINKFKFVKKNSPNTKSGRKIYPHYSKIINSIFNQINEKENKTNIKLGNSKLENGLNKKNNTINRNIFKLNTNLLKNLLINLSPSTINNSNDKNKTDRKSKQSKLRLKNNLLTIVNKNLSKNQILKNNINKSDKNIKIKKYLEHSSIFNVHEEKNGKNLTDRNLKKIIIKSVKNKNELPHKVKKIKNIDNKEINTDDISNKNFFNNYNTYSNNEMNTLQNNKVNNILKKNDNINNSEIFIKKHSISKNIFKKSIDNIRENKKHLANNNKYFSNFNNKRINTTISNFINKKYLGKNSNKNSEKIIKCPKKNESKGKDKILIINIKDKIKKLDLSNISLTKSCNSLINESRILRSYSKKRDETKIKNMRKNELYTERVNKKLDNLYEYIKKLNNNIENNSINIKLIDRIRRTKKLNNNNLYIQTQ